MHNRALGSTCSIPSRLWDLSATASFQFFRPRRAGGPKTRVIFIDFLVVVGNSGGKKQPKKNSVFFFGGGQNMTKWYKMPITACNRHCRLSGQWSGCGNLGAFGGKGIAENISLLSLARCRHSDPHEFLFPIFFPSDCGSALFFLELTIGRCADQVRHTLCIHHLCFGPKVCVSSTFEALCFAQDFLRKVEIDQSQRLRRARERAKVLRKSWAAEHQRSTENPHRQATRWILCTETILHKFWLIWAHFKRQNPKTFKELERQCV